MIRTYKCDEVKLPPRHKGSAIVSLFIIWFLLADLSSPLNAADEAVAKRLLPERVLNNRLLKHLQPNPLSRDTNVSGLEAVINHFYLPEGFEAELIAGEPDLHQPIAFTFDDRGRLWVVEAHSYPQKRPDGEGLDKIIILEDT